MRAENPDISEFLRVSRDYRTRLAEWEQAVTEEGLRAHLRMLHETRQLEVWYFALRDKLFPQRY